MKSDLVDIECEIAQEREKAIAITDGTETVWEGHTRPSLKWFWLPRSQITVAQDGTRTIVTLPQWLAKEKGLI